MAEFRGQTNVPLFAVQADLADYSPDGLIEGLVAVTVIPFAFWMYKLTPPTADVQYIPAFPARGGFWVRYADTAEDVPYVDTVPLIGTTNLQGAIDAIKGALAGGVTMVSGTAPITSTGGMAPNIAITPASGGTAGSMSAADFTKLTGIAVGATNTPLTATAPVDVTKAAAAVGVSTEAARADHKHSVTTATPATVGAANSEGTATSLARSDHVHRTIVDVLEEGAATGSRPTINFIGGAVVAVDNPGLDRVDVTVSAAALTASAPANVTKAAAAVGVATDAARADHKHDISTAAASTIAAANSEGAATTIARSDHVHDHGAQTSGTMHASVIAAGASGFMTGADKTKLDGLPSSAVPTTRTITAGAGLTGGGDLSADRTLDVAANADGSIVVNANDLQVGVLATDAQHGNRGGGGIHAVVVAAGAAGFMSGADKTKLDGVATGATNTPLTAAAPVDVTKAAAVVGVATDAARADHKHNISTATPGTTTYATAAEGTATSLARSDHAHDVSTPAAPVNVTKAAASAGAATAFARDDHKHDVSTGVVGTVTYAAASEGVATSLARSDHVHALTSPASPANVTKSAAAAGASANVAREDHKHDVSTGVPVSVGGANAEGTATTLARSDHVHFSSAGSGASGVGTIDFGAFPGAGDASVVITGQTGIVAGSSVAATVQATATSDHSIDEHRVSGLNITAGDIVAGTGFTIYAAHVPPSMSGSQVGKTVGNTREYGQWSVAWKWS